MPRAPVIDIIHLTRFESWHQHNIYCRYRDSGCDINGSCNNCHRSFEVSGKYKRPSSTSKAFETPSPILDTTFVTISFRDNDKNIACLPLVVNIDKKCKFMLFSKTKIHWKYSVFSCYFINVSTVCHVFISFFQFA